jgi:signal transduction histidine kinase
MRAYLRLERLVERSNQRRGVTWLAPVWGRVFTLSVLTLLLAGLAAAEAMRGVRVWHTPEVGAAGVALGVGWALPALRDSRLAHGAAYLLLTAGGLSLTALGYQDRMPNAVKAAVFMVSVVYAARVSAGLGALSVAAFDVLARDLGGPAILALTLFWVYLFIVGRVLRASRIAQWRAEQVLAERAEAAVLRERARIARDIHDVLGHNLSALAVQLEAARVLLPARDENRESLRQIEEARKLARQGLGELAEAVGTMRGDPPPGLARIGELGARFERDTGVPCRLRIDGANVPAEVQMAIYRTVQEALTNARRHSRPSEVVVRVDCTGPQVCLTIANDGAEGAWSAPGDTGGGYGLDGMRERVELLGGSLVAGRAGGRFHVRATLPR